MTEGGGGRRIRPAHADLPRSAPGPTAAAPRGTLRLLLDPVFGSFFWGKVLSTCGSWVHGIVAAVITFDLTGSTFAVGIVGAAQFLPQLFFAPLSGKMADRGNAARQIVIGRLVSSAGSAGIAAWIWLVGGVDQLSGSLPVLLSSLVVGIGFVIGGPAMQSIVVTLVHRQDLPAAMALNSIPIITARAGGPAVGALVASQWGPGTSFAVAAGAGLAHAAIMVALRLPRTGQAVGTDFSVRASLRHLRTDRRLALLLVGIMAVGVGADPALTLAPPLAVSLGGASSLVGWLTSAFGLGAALGFVLFTAVQRLLGIERLASVGLALMAAGLVGAAVGPSVPVVVCGLVVAGVGMTLSFTSMTTEIQDRSPDELRGRIMALWFVAFVGSRPFASAFNGLVADFASVELALLVNALLTASVAVVCWPRLRRAVVIA